MGPDRVGVKFLLEKGVFLLRDIDYDAQIRIGIWTLLRGLAI